MEAWLDAFVEVAEPSYSYDMQLITLSSKGGGTSRKPGYILLSWRRMFDVGPDGDRLSRHRRGFALRSRLGCVVCLEQDLVRRRGAPERCGGLGYRDSVARGR